MIDQLFGSKTRVKLLQLFFNNPNRAFYVREITRKIDEQINSVRRELSNLLKVGIVSSDTQGHRLYYEVNQKYQHYEALRSIFADSKATAGKKQQDPTVQAITELGAVELVIYTGVFTRDELVEVDVLLVGDINKTKAKHHIDELEREEGRELRFVVMPFNEFEYRRDVNDRFLSNVLSSKKTVVYDPNGLLSEKKKKKGKK